MPSRIGWNVEGTDLNGRRDLIKAELSSYDTGWHLCLGDIELAYALRQRANVIYRVFDPFNEYTTGSSFDNEFWLNHSPQDVVDWIRTRHNDRTDFVWSVGNNEPTTSGKTRQFVQWCVELAHLGYQHGIRFAIAEIASAKTIQHDEIKAGLWDDLIVTMNTYRDFHIFTFHEYTTGLLPATFLPDYPLNLDDPQALAQSNWQSAKMNLTSIDGNWHIGRGALITHGRAKQLMLDPLPFVITECAFDWMADIISTPERAETIAHLENRFRMPSHDFMRGSTGHRQYHEWLMSETGFAGDWNDYLYAQYQWLISAYPPELEGICIFALNADWDLPEGHDMSHPRNDKFRQLVIQDNAMQPIVFDPPLFDAIVSVNNGYLNMRSDMSANSVDLGDITTTPMPLKLSKKTNDANGFTWYKFQQERPAAIVTGYIADVDKLNIEYTEENQQPEQPPATSDQLTPEQIEQIIEAEIDRRMELVPLDLFNGLYTWQVPRVMLPFVRDMAKIAHMVSGELRNEAMRANGEPVLSDITDAIYSASVPDDDSVAVTLSGILDGDNTITITPDTSEDAA